VGSEYKQIGCRPTFETEVGVSTGLHKPHAGGSDLNSQKNNEHDPDPGV